MYDNEWASLANGFGGYANNYLSSMDNTATIVIFKILALLGFASAAILCAFGYKLQRICSCFILAASFGAIGFTALYKYTEIDRIIIAVIALGPAIVGGIIGYKAGLKLYKFLFILGAGISGFALGVGVARALEDGGQTLTVAQFVAGLTLGVLFGFIMFKIFKPLVIVSTGIQGGLGAAFSAICLFGYDGLYDFIYRVSGFSNLFGNSDNAMKFLIPLSLIFIVAGVIFQFKTADTALSDVFSRHKRLAYGDDSGLSDNTGAYGQNAIGDNIIGLQNKATVLLHTPIALPNEINAMPFFLAGALIASVAIFVGNQGFLAIIKSAILTALLVLLFMVSRNINFRYINIAINVLSLIILLFSAWGLVSMVIANGSFFSLLYNAGMGLFAIALWFTVARSNTKQMLYTVSSILLAVYAILFIFKGSFSFVAVSMIVAMIPFSLPGLKGLLNSIKGGNQIDLEQELAKYTAERKQQENAKNHLEN